MWMWLISKGPKMPKVKCSATGCRSNKDGDCIRDEIIIKRVKGKNTAACKGFKREGADKNRMPGVMSTL